MASPFDLTGRIALVTGSTRGIGWETARALAGAGATVLVNGRSDRERTEAAAAALTSEFGRPASACFFDVADPAQIRDAFQSIFKRYGRLDTLVNNAGILRDALLGMITPEAVEETFRVNTFGPILILQEASRLMSRAKRGSIVNVSSIIGRNGNEGQAVYAASKAAIIGLTRATAKELAPKNIRVNAVAPGYIDTDMIRQIPPAKHQERLGSIKMKRVGQPSDVANAVLFLASDAAAYVTGQVLGVDGGMLI